MHCQRQHIVIMPPEEVLAPRSRVEHHTHGTQRVYPKCATVAADLLVGAELASAIQ
jgi:hypothetical protein